MFLPLPWPITSCPSTKTEGTTLVTNKGLFRFCSISYGLASAYVDLQKMISDILEGVLFGWSHHLWQQCCWTWPEWLRTFWLSSLVVTDFLCLLHWTRTLTPTAKHNYVPWWWYESETHCTTVSITLIKGVTYPPQHSRQWTQQSVN